MPTLANSGLDLVVDGVYGGLVQPCVFSFGRDVVSVFEGAGPIDIR